jgi:tetratricopeptide (TPR) repeat protein
VPRVGLSSKSFQESNVLNCVYFVVSPPEPSGSFAEALHLFNQFLQESDLDAAQRCINIYEYLLECCCADLPTHGSDSAALLSKVDDAGNPMEMKKRYHVLIQLARTLEERHLYAGDTPDLECATRHGEEALALCHAKNIVCPTVWVFYADILVSSSSVVKNSTDSLLMADALCREALLLCTASHPLISVIYHTLSRIVRRRFYYCGNEKLIAEALHLQRIGLERLPVADFQNRHRHLSHLAQILTAKHCSQGYQDRDGVLSVLEEAFQSCPPTHVDRCVLYPLMILQMTVEYSHSGEIEFLNGAIKLGRQGLNLGKFINPGRRAYFLALMADSLRIRHETTREDENDLEEAVEILREALRISLLGDINRCFYLYSLAMALTLQFRSDGNTSHLEEASQLFHHASDIVATENPCRRDIISGYAYTLGLSFRETGDIAELNRAIDLGKEAVAEMRPSAVNYAHSTVQMVSHLCLRFEVLHANDDLNDVRTSTEELLRSISDGNPNRIEAVHILAKAHLFHAIDKKSFENIDLAIDQLLLIKDKLSQSSLGPESLRTLAACYVAKFRQSEDIEYAHQAREVMNEVLENVHPGHYERFQCLIDAAKLYLEHGTPFYNIDIALKYLSDALENTHRDVRSKIHGAKQVLDGMEIEHRCLSTTTSSTSLKLLDVTEFAVLLLPRIAFFGVYPYSRLQSLKEGQAIAMTGASLALNLAHIEKALEIMEQGRATFWTHTLRLRSPFSQIPEELRHQLSELARRLEKVVNESENSKDQRYVESEIARRRKDSEEFNSLVRRVRCIPGHERFMLPDEYSTLKGAAKNGPVIILVCSTLACHAIILTPSGKTSSIPLEAINDKWLVESASAWRSSAIQARAALRDGLKLVKHNKAVESSYKRSEQILRLLWINIVFPVIQALQIEVRVSVLLLSYQGSHYNMQPASDRDRPRVWWCPTGYFAHLPIHAAGAGGKQCSDYVVSSYTPTISGLLDARKKYMPVKKKESKALIAAVPLSFSPLWGELVSTNEEVSTVKAALPEGTVISVRGTDTTVNGDICGVTADALLDKLPEATILHLACHGHQDLKNALDSGFMMSDEVLTIKKLMQVPLPQAFMAFLSACETAKGDQVCAGTIHMIVSP